MKVKRYILSKIIEGMPELAKKNYLDKIKIELDWRIYHYGAHFNTPFENKLHHWTYEDLKYDLKNQIILKRNQFKSKTKKKFISSIYFGNFDQNLAKLGEVQTPVWLPRGFVIDGNNSLYKKSKNITNLLGKASFNTLLMPQTASLLDEYESDLFNYYSETDPRAVFLFTDQYYHSKVTIEVFKKINKKSFVLSHGLPGIYSKEVDNRSDYLYVWGNKIKCNYIQAGFNAEKIFVIGHPGYMTPKKIDSLRNSFENILVLPKAMTWHQHTYEPAIADRGAIIVYLLSLQIVLQKFGVKSVRLRPHPSANVHWMLSFLDPSFFIADPYPQLSESLAHTTLAIGPTSTVFLESILNGVNYVIYEPQDDDGIDLLNYKIVPPFDGSDPEIAVAKDEYELEELLRRRYCQPNDVLSGYMSTFDENILKDSIHSAS